MGGCATKPKVSKAEEAGGEAPVPAPETVKEEAVVVESKEKEVVVIGDVAEKKIEGDDHTVKEIVDDEDKRKSLSHLFQSEEGKDSTEKVKTTEVSETGKPLEEKTPDIIVVDAPITAESAEVAIEAAPAETQAKEASDEKTTEEVVEKIKEEVKEIAEEKVAKETSEGQKETEAAKEESVAEEKPKETVSEGKD